MSGNGYPPLCPRCLAELQGKIPVSDERILELRGRGLSVGEIAFITERHKKTIQNRLTRLGVRK